MPLWHCCNKNKFLTEVTHTGTTTVLLTSTIIKAPTGETSTVKIIVQLMTYMDVFFALPQQFFSQLLLYNLDSLESIYDFIM